MSEKRKMLLKVERPWGYFEEFAENEKCTVKIHTVKPGEMMSLQYHEHRDEFYRVISGTGFFVLGDVRREVGPGDEDYITRLTKHRIGADKNSTLIVLEICFGDFDEGDIVHLEDKYGRS